MPSNLLSVGQVAERSGFAPSALRYYERGIGRRRAHGRQPAPLPRSVLRRLAFIRAAHNVGLEPRRSHRRARDAAGRPYPDQGGLEPALAHWRDRLDDQIAALTKLRDGLDSCIGCGCLSLNHCTIQNPASLAATAGAGAIYLPAPLRRPTAPR